jgi:hypothetical protein
MRETTQSYRRCRRVCGLHGIAEAGCRYCRFDERLRFRRNTLRIVPNWVSSHHGKSILVTR